MTFMEGFAFSFGYSLAIGFVAGCGYLVYHLILKRVVKK